MVCTFPFDKEKIFMCRIFIAMCVLFITGCKDEPITKPAPPVIVIITPVVDQHYITGDTIHITGTVTYAAPLSEVAVHMEDIAMSNEFFHNHFTAGNATTYDFNSTHIITSNAASEVEVEVAATAKDGSTATKEIKISIN